MVSQKQLLCFLAIFAFNQLTVQAEMLVRYDLEKAAKSSSVFEAGHVTYIKVYNASLSVRPVLNSLKSVSVKKCAQQCAVTRGCKAFVYRKHESICLLSQHDASEDGIKVVRRSKFDYYQIISGLGKMIVVKGASIDKYDNLAKIKNVSVDRCAAHCKKIKNCKMFEYKAEQGRCDLTDINHKDKVLTASVHKWDYYSLNGVSSTRMFLKVPYAKLNDGTRFNYINDVDVESCATKCLLTGDCIAFEHDVVNSPMCILLSDDATKTKHVISAAKRDFYQLQQERGTMNIILGASINGFDYFRRSAGTLDDCLTRCTQMQNCEAVEYKFENRRCDVANLTHFDIPLQPSSHHWNFFELNGAKNPLDQVANIIKWKLM